jgi:hypothetical protein
MSKYDPLWRHLQADGSQTLKLSFEDVQKILGFPIDHSFLTYKKEAGQFGYQVGKMNIGETSRGDQRGYQAEKM